MPVNSPAKSVAELIALAKAKPGVLTYASAGIGSSNHLSGELLRVMAGINIVHVPYKGSTPALGALVAHAQPDVKEGGGYYGYHFRLLYGQGPDAPGGAYSYLVNGRMIGGYAAIAWPVSYGDTGVMTFIVSFSGQVYEQDLGPDTAQRAGNIAVFNPDSKWQKSDMTPP